MSYRAFKRLLGETSLERKCRFLLGAGVLVLITGSFWFYSRQTEHLAYEVTTTTGRVLVPAILARQHVGSADGKAALDEFQTQSEQHWPEGLSQYKFWIIYPNATDAKHAPPEPEDQAIVKSFLADPDKIEQSQLLTGRKALVYYGAVRATSKCVECHARLPSQPGGVQAQREGELTAVVKIGLPIRAIESGVHVNRALLLSTAIVTAILIMAATYAVIRYVIVKPVKHLKEVSDAISAGQLNVRSEIQTNDEFEDLSHAFNRMLRNLVSMQDRLKKVNTDLDHKVDELAAANLALFESNRVKSDFLATMSHELRTPLNSILGFGEVLLSSTLTDKQGRWVTNIRTSGQQLLTLINDILDLAKIEAGKMELRPEEFTLAEVADGLLGMFRPAAEKKNIDLRSKLPDDLPPLRQDAVKLRQILTNLLSNAIKFTPEGGRVLLKAHADGDFIEVTVGDTGVGIAPEHQEMVFEKFRQASNPMTREQGGTGLGLSIVRELAKLLGGEVTLVSELGRGSDFTVRLPLTLPDAPAADEPPPAEVPQPAKAGAGNWVI